MIGFDYPSGVHERKHGPVGYASYESFREWLRDEFSFRCLYCLKREMWTTKTAEFHIDHVQPQAASPELSLDYDNLIYVCARCNLLKGDCVMPDLASLDLASCISINETGEAKPLSPEGILIVEVLRLNSKEAVDYRRKHIELFGYYRVNNPAALIDWLGFPSNLPDLNSKRPGGNTRPSGLNTCYCSLREREELPDMY